MARKGKAGRPHPQPQSAKTGKFVTESYAKKHPGTTFTEGGKKGGAKKGK